MTYSTQEHERRRAAAERAYLAAGGKPQRFISPEESARNLGKPHGEPLEAWLARVLPDLTRVIGEAGNVQRPDAMAVIAAADVTPNAAPALTGAERDVCQKLGISEDAYSTAKAQGASTDGLTASEREICQALGIDERAYAEAKRQPLERGI